MLADLFRRAARPNTAALSKDSAPGGPLPSDCFRGGGPSYSSTADPSGGGKKKTLAQLRIELFNSYDAPPAKTVAFVVSQIRRISGVNDFRTFSLQMGFTVIPSDEEFTDWLRFSVVPFSCARVHEGGSQPSGCAEAAVY